MLCHRGPLSALAVDVSGTHMVTAGVNHLLCLDGMRLLQGRGRPVTRSSATTAFCISGVDNQIKVWDIRMMRPLHAYFSYSPAKSLEISQRGLLAVGYGRKVQVRNGVLEFASFEFLPVCY